MSSVNEVIEAVRTGDRRAAARLITALERWDRKALEVLYQLRSDSITAHRIVFTGPPGVGKSSLINALVSVYRTNDERIGIISQDPASQLTGGALLGDRIRMQGHAVDRDVFIRSVPVRSDLEGAVSSVELIVPVMEAMGFNRVLVETVGVGQSEPEVSDLADTTVVVEAPGLGDNIQLMKAGLLEVGDVVVLNKKDLPGGIEASARLKTWCRERSRRETWQCPLVETSAHTGNGVDELFQALDKHWRYLLDEDRLQGVRKRKRMNRLKRLLSRKIETRVNSTIADNQDLTNILQEAVAGRRDLESTLNTVLDRLLPR
ncbi:MAG: methylmalonyl Co-A mutase-associated GTPase MeaB [bacterium]|jgi:LAO/AO transport system kinase|nr:methylmalonyl Co-A mutase-associated GTPase MeaB [bacterium]